MVEEISAEELHRRSRSSTTVRAEDINIVTKLIKERFPDLFVTKVTKQTILIFGFDGTEEDLKVFFGNAGVQVAEISIKEGSLESYYLYKMEDYEYNRSRLKF